MFTAAVLQEARKVSKILRSQEIGGDRHCQRLRYLTTSLRRR